jgi:hypothetical protein
MNDEDKFWAAQNKMWRQGRSSGELGYMTASGYVLKGSKEDQQLKEKELTMAYEYKEGQGSLFVNDKGDNPSRPDRTGKVMIGGKMYKISGWIKESTNGGKPWLSLVVQEDVAAAPAPSPKPAAPVDEPF